MPSVVIFYTRLPELSPAQFKDHMETQYLPKLVAAMACHPAPAIKVQYVERAESGAGDRLGANIASKSRNPPDAPVVLVGSPSELGWDAMCSVEFHDELQLQQCLALANSDRGQPLKDEEERFSQPDLMKAVLMGASYTMGGSTN